MLAPNSEVSWLLSIDRQNITFWSINFSKYNLKRLRIKGVTKSRIYFTLDRFNLLLRQRRFNLLFPYRKLHIRSAWVGLNDKGYENVFRWDGSNFPGFKKWCPHEPNNYRYGEDCVELLGPNNYKCLNDLPCTRALPYICEVNRRYYK